MRTIRADLAAVLLLLLSFVLGPAARGQEPVDAQSLVTRLGDGAFAVREQATADLIEMGTAALAAIEAAEKSPDREVRLRATKIAAAIRRADFDQRLDAFASGASENDASLPGWREYRDSIGDDAQARSLFVEMQRADGELLAAAAKPDGASAQRLLDGRLAEMGRVMQQQPDEEIDASAIAACLWSASSERITLTEESIASLFALCHQSNLKSALAVEAPDNPMRRLLGSVIRRTDGPIAHPAMALALNFSLDDALAPAERTIKQGAAPAQLLQFAIITIARFGNVSHTSLLETLFANDARCAGYRADDVEHVTQVRDLALAAAIHLAGKEPREFGFAHVQTQAQTVFAPASLGFAGEKERAQAFAMWGEAAKKLRSEEAKKR